MITNVSLTPASADDRSRGLLGWVSLTAGIWHFDSLALRRTQSGRLAVSFPVRFDRNGKQHPVVRPLDDRARRMIEREIIAKLGLTDAKKR
jgi:hypothetical protein